MISTKLTASVTTVMMLAGGVAAATAQPARAAAVGHVYAASVNGHSRATFKSSGNWFYVFDTRADGSSGLGQIYYAKKYRTISASGFGNITGHQFNDIRNGAHFKFRACYGNSVRHHWKLKHCSSWVNAIA